MLLSHAIDRLLAAAEAWEHSDEAPARKAALLAVQEIVLVRFPTGPGPPSDFSHPLELL